MNKDTSIQEPKVQTVIKSDYLRLASFFGLIAVVSVIAAEPVAAQASISIDTEQAEAYFENIDQLQAAAMFAVAQSGTDVPTDEALVLAQAVDPEQAEEGAAEELVAEEDIAQDEPVDLFGEAPEAAELADQQAELLAVIEDEPTTADVRVVTINVEALLRDVVGLNPAADERFSARTQRTEDLGNDAFNWFGELQDVRGNAILAVRDNRVAGTIWTEDNVYSVRYLGDDLHAIVRIDQEGVPPDHPPEWEEMMQEADDERGSLPHDHQDTRESAPDLADQVRVLRLLVAYTPAVRAAVADIDLLIQALVAETTQTYMNSTVNLTVEIVDSYEVNYTESGNMVTDLNRWVGTADGHMDEVHVRRRHYGADVGMLLTNSGQFCGVAPRILADRDTAFAVTGRACTMAGQLTFAHEIGHLQGAHHNPEAPANNTVFAFGHGFRGTNFRTVMSYNCPNGCPRIPYWSNPNIQFGGVTIGTAATHNNARVLNQTAPIITSFRGLPAVGALGYAWANNPTTASYAPMASYAYNSSGGDIQVTRSAPGSYAVRFAGLGGQGTSGGHVQVTAYGPSNENCKVAWWSSHTSDFIANVRCFNTVGNAVDARYTVQVNWP
jgi:hypothetical protein